MKAKDLRKLSEDELVKKREELKETLFKLRFQLTRGQLTNTSKIKEVKRDIARINTILTELQSSKRG